MVAVALLSASVWGSSDEIFLRENLGSDPPSNCISAIHGYQNQFQYGTVIGARMCHLALICYGFHVFVNTEWWRVLKRGCCYQIAIGNEICAMCGRRLRSSLSLDSSQSSPYYQSPGKPELPEKGLPYCTIHPPCYRYASSAFPIHALGRHRPQRRCLLSLYGYAAKRRIRARRSGKTGEEMVEIENRVANIVVDTSKCSHDLTHVTMAPAFSGLGGGGNYPRSSQQPKAASSESS